MFKIGHGYDIHRLQNGGRLVLAGIVVAEDVSPIAHSDGDVVMHALVDAILGAMGWGDIGEKFPDTDPKWKGADSSIFLQEVLSQLNEAGFAVGNADITILAERPKLKPFKAAMVENLGQRLRSAPRRTADPTASPLVNVKAGTNEGCDAIGRGEAIAAHAVVLVKREDMRT